MKNKILLSCLVTSLCITPALAWYEEIDCTTDNAFAANNCNQCFNGGTKVEWDNIWMMTDLWENNTSTSRLLYKEEQEMPQMINLNSDKVAWKERPSSDGFWKYTSELDSRYNESEDAYILWANDEVVWLQSSVGYAYGLTQNDVEKDGNIGLLVYTIITHDINDGVVSDDSETHKECVLFKSGENEANTSAPVEPVEPVTPTVVPETWPEHILLVALALILGFGVLRLRRKSFEQ